MNFIQNIDITEFIKLEFNGLELNNVNKETFISKDYEEFIINIINPKLKIKPHLIYRSHNKIYLCNNYNNLFNRIYIMYIIFLKNNTYIKFINSVNGLIMSYIDNFKKFDMIYKIYYYSFCGCYLYNENAFNELINNIYNYNNFSFSMKQFQRNINRLIDIIKADLLLHNI